MNGRAATPSWHAMRVLWTLLVTLGALVVLTTGLAPGAALARSDAPPPCHETASHPEGIGAPSPAPVDHGQIADCCVACVWTPGLQPPARARLTPPRPATLAPPATLPVGERPAPEPHPPRRLPA